MRLSGGHPTEGDHSGPFDIDGPTIGNLAQDLLDAIQAAARDAQDDGVTMVVTSGDYVVRSRGRPAWMLGAAPPRRLSVPLWFLVPAPLRRPLT